MKYFLSLFIGVLPEFLLGQYTYFNEGYLPPFPDVGCGGSTNLMLREDSIFAYGFDPFIDEYGRTILVIDGNGQLLETWLYSEQQTVLITNFSDNVIETQTGYEWSGSDGWHPILIVMNSQFEEVARKEYPELHTETTRGGFFHSVLTSTGHFISSGLRVYDLIPDAPGDDFANLILAKHNSEGNEEWFHEYTAEDLEISADYSGPFIIPRGGVVLLGNGNIVVFGSVGNDNDCIVLKFDSLGSYIDHVTWGNATHVDGNPWPVQISGNEFLFAYNLHSHFVGQWGMAKPRVGKLNTDDMSIDVYDLLDHPFTYTYLSDFEPTPDGNFAMLGIGYDPDGEDQGRAFIIKVDQWGNEIWFKEYLPPEPWETPDAYDLEITPDGGFAFVGNYYPLEGDLFCSKTWVVKTDACGDLQNDGCPVGVDEVGNTKAVVNVYPNPAHDLLLIDFAPAGVASIELYDAQGKLVMQQKVSDTNTQFFLNIIELPNSLYQMRLQNTAGQTIASETIIKE
ncbi:MAG: T9SS type A sorting domain-containing protein [Flavobacteriales bacterium]